MTLREYIAATRQLGLTRRTSAILIGLQFSGTFFESLGLGMMLPIAQIMINEKPIATLIAESRMWHVLNEIHGFLGLTLGLESLLIISFAVLLFRQTFLFLRQVYTARVYVSLTRDVRDKAFGLFLRADQTYHERVPVGEIVNDLTTELERAVSAVTAGIVLVNFFILAFAYIVLMFSVSTYMTFAVLVTLILVYLPIRMVMSRSEARGEQMTMANKSMSGFLVERLVASRLIRLCGTEGAEMTALAKRTHRQRHQYLHLSILNAITESSVEPIAIAVAFIMLYTGHSHFDLKLPEIGVFLVIIMRLMPIAKTIMMTRQGILSNLASLRTIMRRFTEMDQEREQDTGKYEFSPLTQNIYIQDLTFHYEGRDDVPALKQINLTIPAKGMTALVGPSGSGKSTLVDLLPRLRTQQQGVISFDGRDIREFTLDSLRGGISYAPQTPQIFDVTISEHVRYGKPNASEDEIREALNLAGALNFVDALPDGLNTRLGSAGIRLSGGQKQRIDLARALVRKASILILDEPTSNLDADAEAAFRDVLLHIQHKTDMTVIIIGHRLSTVQQADTIVVLHHGRIEQMGSHKELIAKSGWYADAYAKQSLDDPLDLDTAS